MPTKRSAASRVPWTALAAAVLALPTAFVLVVVGWGALVFADQRADGAVWVVLLLSIGWLAGLLASAIGLLLGRSWAGLACTSGVLAVLMVSGLFRGGLGEGPLGFGPLAAIVSVATTVLAALPDVRHWVAEQRQERLYPGSTAAAATVERRDTPRSERSL